MVGLGKGICMCLRKENRLSKQKRSCKNILLEADIGWVIRKDTTKVRSVRTETANIPM